MDSSEQGDTPGRQGPGIGTGGRDSAAAPEGRVERILQVFLDESMLWPVLIVLVAHAVAFLAPVLLFGLRDRNLFGMAGIAVLVVASLSGLRRDWQRGRLRRLTAVVLCVWLLAGLAAWAGDRYGIL